MRCHLCTGPPTGHRPGHLHHLERGCPGPDRLPDVDLRQVAQVFRLRIPRPRMIMGQVPICV